MQGLEYRVMNSTALRLKQTNGIFLGCVSEIFWKFAVCTGCCCGSSTTTTSLMSNSITHDVLSHSQDCDNWCRNTSALTSITEFANNCGCRFLSIDKLFRSFFASLRAETLVMKTACCSPQAQFALDGDKSLDVCSGQTFPNNVSGDADKGVTMADPAWPIVSNKGFCMMFTSELRDQHKGPACTGDNWDGRGAFSYYLKSEDYVKHRGACKSGFTSWMNLGRGGWQKRPAGLPQCSDKKWWGIHRGIPAIGCNFPKVRNHDPVVVHLSHLLGFHEQLLFNYTS